MKKTKRILSMLTALAISASSFAAMVIPASAAVTPTTQNFDALEETPWVIPDITSTLTVDGTNKYASFRHVTGKNSRAASYAFASVGAGEDYVVEFDMRADAHGDQSASFAVEGTDRKYANNAVHDGVGSGYVFKMEASNSTTWKLNDADADTVVLEKSVWYHYKVAVKDNTTYLTITNPAGSTDAEKAILTNHAVSVNGAGGLQGLYWRNGRAASEMDIDNIVLREIADGDTPSYSLYNVTANTTQYAAMTYTITDPDGTVGEEKTAYAGDDGVIAVSNIIEGSSITYTLSKTGYTSSETKTYTNLQENKTDNIPLSLDSEHNGYLYYEADWTNGSGNWTNGGGTAGRSASTALAPDGVEFPAGIFTIHTLLNVGGYGNENTGKNPVEPENPVIHMVVNTDKGKFAGLHWQENATGTAEYETGIYAFTGWEGSSAFQNYDDDSTKLTNKIMLSKELTTEDMQVDFTVDTTNSLITVRVDGEIKGTLPITEATKESSKITGLQIGQYRYKNDVHVKEVYIDEPNPDTVLVSGEDLEFAKIAGQTLTQTFKATPVLPVAGEGFTWSVTNTDGTAVGEGVSIDPSTGVFSVTDAATAGTVRVTATSDKTSTKKGYVDVVIHDYADLTPTIEGPKTIQTGQTGTYKVTKIVDEYGDDVTEYYTPVWSINGQNTDTNVDFTGLEPGKATAVSATYEGTALKSVFTEEVTVPSTGSLTYSTVAGAKVMIWNSLEGMEPISVVTQNAPDAAEIGEDTKATVSGKTGVVTTYKDGDVALTVTLADGQTATYDIKVDTFYLTDPQINEGKVNIAGLVEDDAITGYQITTVKNGAVQTSIVEKASVVDNTVTVGTVDYDNGDELEIAPIFGTVIGTELLVPADTYNITVTANNANRADVYVNDQMVINNLNQQSVENTKWAAVSGAKPESASYTVKDIVVNLGSAKFKYEDKQGEPVTAISMVKSPSIVDRVRKVYVIGDSLVCNYYDRESTTEKQIDEQFCRTGWGQVIGDYLKNVDVVNLGNSGAWAAGMYHDAFTQVRESAKPGDIVLWESGYNDRNNPKEMNGTQRADLMKESITAAVNECNEMGVDIYLLTPNASQHDLKPSPNYAGYMRELNKSTGAPLIDLGQLSFDFFREHYTVTSTTDANGNVSYAFSTADNATVLKYFSDAEDRLHSTTNAANCFAALVAGALYDAGETNIVDTEYTYTFTDDKATPETFTIKATPSAN